MFLNIKFSLRTEIGWSIIIIIILFIVNFLHQHQVVFFHLNLRDSKFLQVSRILLYILVDFNNAIVRIVKILSLVYSSLAFFLEVFTNHSKCTNYNWSHCHFHVPQLFEFSNKVQKFLYLFVLFYFQSVVHWNGKVRMIASSFFL